MLKKTIKTRQAVTETTVRAAAESEADSNTMELVFTTGYKGLRNDWIQFYEELEVTPKACDLTRLKAGAPFLLNHRNNVYEQIGVVEDAWIKDGVGSAKIRFSSREEFKGVIQDIKDRIIRNISVGYEVHEFTETTKKGEQIPTYLATKWEPLEISAVAVGFDPGAQTTQRNNQTSNEVTIIPNGELTMTEEEKQKQEAAEKAAKEAADKQAAEQRAKDISDASAAAVKAHKERSAQIRSQVKAANLTSEFADSLIEKDLTAEQVSQEIFNEVERTKNLNKTKTETTTMEVRDKKSLAVKALLYRVNARKYDIKDEDKNELKGVSTLRILESVLPRENGENDTKYVQRAITTGTLTELLSNVANKILEDSGKAAAQPTYKLFTSPRILRDFKPTPIVDLSLFGLAAKTEAGDYDEATLSDTGENIQLAERGIRFVITQKAIINDDLGALAMLPQKANFAGHVDVEKAVYEILNSNPNMADGVPFFHADHGNLNAAGAEPTVESVAAAMSEMMKQTDLSGEKLEIRGKYLIVPSKYELAARKVATAIVASSSTDVNPFGGKLEVIVSDRITADSGECWFLVADPNVIAAIVTGTLEGQEEPSVSTDVNFRSSNLEVKIEYPNAAKAANYRAIYKTVVDLTP